MTLLHPTFSETKLGGDALSTCALPKQQQNLVADFRRNFLAHKNVPRKCLAFWGQFIYLFVRKNKDDAEAKSFYFLGEIDAEGEPEPVKVKGYDAFEINYRLRVPVRNDIYTYLTS